MSVVFFFAPEAEGQRRFSKVYPAGKSVKLQLMNRSGTVTVQGWNRPEVAVSAYLEAPAASINPAGADGVIVINVVRDNHGRSEVGSVNFDIRVPFDATVDIETKIGNLNVSNLRGAMLRAKISSDGDITLTNIGSFKVLAENGIGNIFFDGEIVRGGTYWFQSLQGDINLRIPFNASVKLVATAPSTRRINLGGFGEGGMRAIGDGRRIVGATGDGASALTVTNQRGSISFLRR